MNKDTEVCKTISGAEDRQVNVQLEKLDRTNVVLMDLIDKIADNLVSILRPQDPPVAEKKETVREGLVPLANGIRICRDSVAGVVERMRDLLDRLEVS